MSSTANETRGPYLMAVSWAQFSIATVLVALRVYTTFVFLRGKASKFSIAATLAAVLAWAIGLVNAILIQLSVDHGIGHHLVDIPQSELPKVLLYKWLADATSRLSVAAGKVAVVFFLCAIQQGIEKKWQRFLLAFIAITNVAFNVAVFFTILFQCSPPQKLWHMEIPGNCAGSKVNGDYGFFTTSWGAASDLTLALYPTYLLWKVDMDRKTKVGICVLCGLGIFASVSAAITCWELHVVTNSTDPTWIQVPLSQWGFTEAWVVIMAASIPPSLPTLRRALPNSVRSVQRSIRSAITGNHTHRTIDETELSSNQSKWDSPKWESSRWDAKSTTEEGLISKRPSEHSEIPSTPTTFNHDV